MIYYESSNGIKIELDKWPVVIEDITKLFGKGWSYEVTENKKSNKTELERFYRTSTSKKITLQVYADSEEEYCDVMNKISDATDRDIMEKTPGKIWVGDYYLECYITNLEPDDYDDLFYTTDIDITIEAFYPFWINKKTYAFHSNKVTSSDNKNYPGRYPYRYANGLEGNYIINPHFTDSNFQMIIYGAVVNPQITIGNNTYLVNIILEEGEYLEIDSRKKTVTKIKNNGEKVNAYHNRQKGIEFFKKINPGRQEVIGTGKFDFDLIIFEERSEPKWKPMSL